MTEPTQIQTPDDTQNEATRPDWLPEKFWDPKAGTPRYEDLAKSYSELEKGRSTPAPTAPAPTKPTAPGSEGGAADAVKAAGLDWAALTKEFTDSGKLSEETFAALAAGGIPREIAEDYISARGVAMNARKATTATYLAAAHGDGNDGDQMLGELLEWAAKNLLPAQIDEYNKMLNNDGEWKAAVDHLAIKYKQANPLKAEGDPVLPIDTPGSGGAGGAGGAYTSLVQQTAAINDPRYRTDPAYRDAVRARVAISKFK